MLRIKLVKSLIGNNWRNRRTVQALGLRKVGQVVEHADTASIRGMIQHVKHMLAVEVPEGTTPVADATSKGASSRPLKASVHAPKPGHKPNKARGTKGGKK